LIIKHNALLHIKLAYCFFVAFQNRKPPPRVKSDDDVLTFSTSYLEGMCAS